jgi:hypothetical protein
MDRGLFWRRGRGSLLELMDGGEPCWFFILSYGSLGVVENFVRKDVVLKLK